MADGHVDRTDPHDHDNGLRISTIPVDELPRGAVVPAIESCNDGVRRTFLPDGADEAIVVEYDPEELSTLVGQGAGVEDSTRRTLERHGWRSAYRTEQVELWVADTRALHARLDRLSQSPALDTSRRLPDSVLFENPVFPDAPSLG